MKTLSKTLLMAGAATLFATGAVANEYKNGVQSDTRVSPEEMNSIDSSLEENAPQARSESPEEMNRQARQERSNNQDWETQARSDTRAQSQSQWDQKAPMELSSAAIEDVQESLNDEGFNLAVDGILGPNTSSALRSFQANNNLDANGEINQETLAELDINMNQSGSVDSMNDASSY